MELLENSKKKAVERDYEFLSDSGKMGSNWSRAAILLLKFGNSTDKNEFVNKSLEKFPGKFEVYDQENDSLQQLVILRAGVSTFLGFIDDGWPGGGTYDKAPSAIATQWERATVKLPELLAAGTIVENLRRKSEKAFGTRHKWGIWLEHPVQAIYGTDVDAGICMELFKEWVDSISNMDPDELLTSGGSKVTRDDTVLDVIIQLETHKNVIIEGVAGSGKTHLLDALKEKYAGRTTVLVFHPSTSYEDFVVGLRPQSNGFAVVPGPFLAMCERASRDPDQNYLLFIDEVNRANTARVLGDLLMVIESSKRSLLDTEILESLGEVPDHWDWKTEDFQTVLTDAELNGRTDLVSVQLQTPLDGGRKHLIVPPNLHILGTMNTTDRSVGTIDLALRRRFRWITAEVLAGEKLKSALGDDRANDLVQVIEWHKKANETLRKDVGPDAQLGHSYFFTSGASALEVAEALVNQLAEIAHTFNISDTLVDIIFRGEAPELPGNLQLHQHGRGLGKRFLTSIPGA